MCDSSTGDMAQRLSASSAPGMPFGEDALLPDDAYLGCSPPLAFPYSSDELAAAAEAACSSACSLESDAAAVQDDASDANCAESYRQLATAHLLRAALLGGTGSGSAAAASDAQALDTLLRTERRHARVQREQVQAELLDVIASKMAHLQVLEEHERRLGGLQAALHAAAGAPGGLAGHFEEVLQIVRDMNEARRLGGLHPQEVAAAVTRQIGELPLQAGWQQDVQLSLRQLLAAFVRGEAHRVVLRSTALAAPFEMPLQRVGALSLEEYSGLHTSFLLETSAQLDSAAASPARLTSLVHDAVLLRFAFLLCRWSTFLSFRAANAANTPLAAQRAAAEGAAVQPEQARALHALWRRHAAAEVALGAREAATKDALRGALREAPPAAVPHARLLDAAEELSAAAHERVLASIDFNNRAAYSVLRPEQMAVLTARTAPQHLRIDLLLENGLIPCPPAEAAQ